MEPDARPHGAASSSWETVEASHPGGGPSDSGTGATSSSLGSSTSSLNVPGRRASGLDEAAMQRHAYLGDIDDVATSGGCGILQEGATYNLPARMFDGVVLFPGATLPLIQGSSRDRLQLQGAMTAEPPLSRLMFVMFVEPGMLHKADHVGCIAEIKRLGEQEDGSIHAVALARQRGVVHPSSPDFREYVARTGTWPGRVDVTVLPEGCQQGVPAPIRQLSAWHAPWAARPFDIHLLAAEALRLAGVVLGHKAAAPGASPLDVSYWLAANLPLPEEERQQLLELRNTADRLRHILRLVKALGALACCSCHTVLAGVQDVLPIGPQGATGSIFVNAHGFVHDLVAFKRVAGAALSGRPETAHSWFPGYAWTIASCAVCGQHLGWEFTAAQAGLEPPRFWGLRRSCLAAVNEEEGISMALASDGA